MVADRTFWLGITINLMLLDPLYIGVERREFPLMPQWHQMMRVESHFITTLKHCNDLTVNLRRIGIAASDSVLLFEHSWPIEETDPLVVGKKMRVNVHPLNAVQ